MVRTEANYEMNFDVSVNVDNNKATVPAVCTLILLYTGNFFV